MPATKKNPDTAIRSVSGIIYLSNSLQRDGQLVRAGIKIEFRHIAGVALGHCHKADLVICLGDITDKEDTKEKEIKNLLEIKEVIDILKNKENNYYVPTPKATKFNNFPQRERTDFKALEMAALRKRLERSKKE